MTVRDTDYTMHEPAFMDSDVNTYTKYKRYEITLKNVWEYKGILHICSEKGEGFGIAKTYHYSKAQYDKLKSQKGKRVTVWAMQKTNDLQNKWLGLE